MVYLLEVDHAVASSEVCIELWESEGRTDGVVGHQVCTLLHHAPRTKVAEEDTVRQLPPRVGHCMRGPRDEKGAGSIYMLLY